MPSLQRVIFHFLSLRPWLSHSSQKKTFASRKGPTWSPRHFPEMFMALAPTTITVNIRTLLAFFAWVFHVGLGAKCFHASLHFQAWSLMSNTSLLLLIVSWEGRCKEGCRKGRRSMASSLGMFICPWHIAALSFLPFWLLPEERSWLGCCRSSQPLLSSLDDFKHGFQSRVNKCLIFQSDSAICENWTSTSGGWGGLLDAFPSWVGKRCSWRQWWCAQHN